MNILGLAKTIVDITVSVGAGAVVGNAIKASTPADVKTLQKVAIGVGGFVLSGMAGSMAAKHATEQIDTTVEQIKELKGSFPKNN